MSTQVTITLPEDVYQQASRLSRLLDRPMDILLAEAIESSLRPLGRSSEEQQAMTAWSDAEVLSATDKNLPVEDDHRLSELLAGQQADVLTAEESSELATLMQVYQEALLCKARALREAVHRGLRGPLEP